MKVKDLKKQLENLPDDLEVCIMNCAIEDDCDESGETVCPAFPISSTELFTKETGSNDFFSLQYTDESHITC